MAIPRFETCPVCKRKVELTYTLARDQGRIVTTSVFTQHLKREPDSRHVDRQQEICAGSRRRAG